MSVRKKILTLSVRLAYISRRIPLKAKAGVPMNWDRQEAAHLHWAITELCLIHNLNKEEIIQTGIEICDAKMTKPEWG